MSLVKVPPLGRRRLHEHEEPTATHDRRHRMDPWRATMVNGGEVAGVAVQSARDELGQLHGLRLEVRPRGHVVSPFQIHLALTGWMRSEPQVLSAGKTSASDGCHTGLSPAVSTLKP
jgi:hypothetical protein